MALVDDDEIEEVGRILAEIRRGFAVLRRTAHEGLEDGEEQAGILWDLALLADVLRLDSDHCVIRERGERREIVIGLVGEVVAVGKEENARAACWFAAFPVGQVPSRIEKFPGDLEGNGCFSGAGGERQQHAVPAVRNSLQHAIDRNLLIEADQPCAALSG